MTWFYEGLPSGQTIPWSAWVSPLFWWMSFIGALLVVCFCTVVVLRRQWIDRERIVFPLAQVLLIPPFPDRSCVFMFCVFAGAVVLLIPVFVCE